ncbi:MAG: YfhO family protein [Chloroflexi bacterium]|nr:MAG: YfhO family protein [Chloroflexota bacterium]
MPPHSAAIAWLQEHADGRPVAPIGLGTLIPETATLYGLSDVRAYDVLQPLGARAYWSLADPGYYNDGLNVWLFHPQAEWLAAAGVGYVINPGDEPLVGTTAAYQGEGVTISQVPGARPLAFTSDTVACAASPEAAANLLAQRGPMGPVVLQTGACPVTSVATVRVRDRRPERIAISVEAALPTVVVVLQSYMRDWSATVDGQPAPILKANLYFQAVPVPAGAHQLSFTYAPSAVRVGAIISVTAIGLLFLLCMLEIARRLFAGSLADSRFSAYRGQRIR